MRLRLRARSATPWPQTTPVALATVVARARTSAPSCWSMPDACAARHPRPRRARPRRRPRRAGRARGGQHRRAPLRRRTARTTPEDLSTTSSRRRVHRELRATAADARSSAPSTSPPRWPRSPRCSATGSTVCDAREVFATKRRFPMADEVVVTGRDRCSTSAAPTLGPRRGVHPHPRPEVRRARRAGRARQPRSATSA